MCRCPIVVFLDFSIFLLISFSVRPDQVFRKPCLVYLRRIYVVGMKISAWRYCASSGFGAWSRILFVTYSCCWVSRVTSHIPVFFVLVPLFISCPFFWTGIYFFSSVMVHSSSHKTPNDISGGAFIFGKIWIFLAYFFRPSSWSVAMCEDSIVITSGILAVISFGIIKGDLVVVDFFLGVYLHLSL